MELLKYEDRIIFKFESAKNLIINKKTKNIEYWEGRIPFSHIKGYWKNHHPKGWGRVYYVMLLTSKKIHKITPEIKDEEFIDEVIKNLKICVPLEVR